MLLCYLITTGPVGASPHVAATPSQGRQERLQHKHSVYVNDIHVRGDKKDYNTNTVRISMIFTSGETKKTTTQT